MNRREAVFGLLSAGASLRIGWAQQPSQIAVIGFLSSRSLAETSRQVTAFRQGLAEAGYVEGRNLTIEYRWAEGRYERLPALAADLVGKRVAVIATAGGSPSALAAKAATKAIPIVFNSGGDLVRLGLVSSYNRPVGNVTGISQFAVLLGPKRLELLRDLMPNATSVAMLANEKNPNIEIEQAQMQEAARSLGLKLSVIKAGSEKELAAAFETLSRQRIDGLVVSADAFLDDRRRRIIALAARKAIPAIYPWPDHVIDGGLMSYGIDPADTYRQAGIYAARILKGAKPEELPVMQPTKFEMLINLKTASTLKITVPPPVLLRADQVIK